MSAVRQLIDGSLLEEFDGTDLQAAAQQAQEIAARGGNPKLAALSGGKAPGPKLPADIRSLIFLRGQLRDVASQAARLPPVNVPTLGSIPIALATLRQFAIYDFGAWVVATAVMGNYDRAVAEHRDHKFGDCPCVPPSGKKDPLFESVQTALSELRTMWNLRVVTRITSHLESAMLSVLRQVWAGESGNMQLVQQMLDMARKTGAIEWARDVILREWTQHCLELAKGILSSGDLSAVVSTVQMQLADAKSRVIDPLPHELAKPMLAVAVSSLVLQHKAEWTAGLIKWFRERRYESGRALWNLRAFAVEAGSTAQWFLDAVGIASRATMAELLNTLSEEVKATDFQKDVVDAFEEHVAEFVSSCCAGRETVLAAAREGGYAEMFRSKPAAGRHGRGAARSDDSEFFALLCAQMLHHAAQSRDGEARERTLDRYMELLKHQPDKDLCVSSTRTYLEHRINQGMSASSVFEAEIVHRLQAAGLHSFAKEIQGVLHDVQHSENECERCVQTRAGEPQLSVAVLKTGAWRTLDPAHIVLSNPTMQRQLKRFTQLYHTGPNEKKVLNWCHAHGWAKVAMLYTKSKHTLVCPVATAVMLGTFDAMLADTLPREDLEAAVLGQREGAQEAVVAHVAKCVRALVKSKVLIEEADGAQLRINKAFRAMRRETVLLPKIGAVTKRHGRDEHLNTAAGPGGAAAAPAAANTDEAGGEVAAVDHGMRNMLLDSALVRVLKARRVVRHHELVETVVETLRQRFVPTPGDIKKSIERLLDKEYCQRAPDDPSCYEYLA